MQLSIFMTSRFISDFRICLDDLTVFQRDDGGGLLLPPEAVLLMLLRPSSSLPLPRTEEGARPGPLLLMLLLIVAVANGEDAPAVVRAAVATALRAAGAVHTAQRVRMGLLLRLLASEAVVLMKEGAPLGRKDRRMLLLLLLLLTQPGLVVVHLHVDVVIAHLACQVLIGS